MTFLAEARRQEALGKAQRQDGNDADQVRGSSAITAIILHRDRWRYHALSVIRVSL